MHPVPCPTLPDTQACPLQGLLSTFPVPSNTRILLCRLMFYRTLLHTLLTQPIPLSKTPSLLFYPKIYFPLAQQETKSTCASCSSSFQGNVLHWLKSFSFPLSTAFSPHLCLRACCMIQNSFVARRRIQFENVNQKKKGDFTLRHHRCLKKCSGRNAMVLNLDENCKAIGLLFTLLFSSSQFASFFFCTLTSCGFVFAWPNPNFERENLKFLAWMRSNLLAKSS